MASISRHRRLVRASTALLAVAAASLLGARAARAYPQWQFSTEAQRCSACHFSPTGGGLINSYGRDEVGEELSTFKGNGALLHGAAPLPRWLALGGDLRGAYVANDVQDPNGAQQAFFPMQADLYARVALPQGFSVYGAAGLRGQVRETGAVVPDENYQPISVSQLVSREHYAMWQRSTLGLYVRAGRFYAPFGLRLAEHVLYIRRDLGFNLMEESYNLSAGWVASLWELHVTAFAPDLVRHMGGTEWGGAAYFERHVLDDKGAVGAQAKVAYGNGTSDIAVPYGNGTTKITVGGIGKLYLEPFKTLLLGEANLVHNVFPGTATNQLVGAAGFALLPARGVMVTMLAERNQTDLRVADATWNAATGLVSWFPYAHVEVQLMGRLQFPAGQDVAKTFLAQLHYFL